MLGLEDTHERSGFDTKSRGCGYAIGRHHNGELDFHGISTARSAVIANRARHDHLALEHIRHEVFALAGALDNFEALLGGHSQHHAPLPFQGQHHGTFQRHENAATNRAALTKLLLGNLTALVFAVSCGCTAQPKFNLCARRRSAEVA